MKEVASHWCTIGDCYYAVQRWTHEGGGHVLVF